jgi:hypothetical protein
MGDAAETRVVKTYPLFGLGFLGSLASNAGGASADDDVAGLRLPCLLRRSFRPVGYNASSRSGSLSTGEFSRAATCNTPTRALTMA